MKRFGVTSDHLALLANDCLDIQPEILPCDIFKSESKLEVNKSYIINSQTSNLSGSHFLCVLIKPKEIYYFDSLAFPLLNCYIDTKLKLINMPIRSCNQHQAIQGANSVFCGYYCLSFLIVCQKRKKSFDEYLKMFSFDRPECYIRNEEICTSIIKSALTVS